MPVVPFDVMKKIISRGLVSFETLHEICAVKYQQSGDSEPLIIALRNRQNCQKIVQAQPGGGGAHVDEGGQRGGHM